MSRTRTTSALHNVPLINLATEQIDLLYFIKHLQHSRDSHYPQILLTSPLLLVCAFSTFTSASEMDVLSLLKRDLGEKLQVRSDKEIWYCPDNSCEMYKAVEEPKDFPMFVYLQLFHASGSIYLNESISGDLAFRKLAVEEPKVRKLASKYCEEDPLDTNCIILNMQRELGIETGFGRYDEGYFCYGYRESENFCNKP